MNASQACTVGERGCAGTAHCLLAKAGNWRTCAQLLKAPGTPGDEPLRRPAAAPLLSVGKSTAGDIRPADAAPHLDKTAKGQGSAVAA